MLICRFRGDHLSNLQQFIARALDTNHVNCEILNDGIGQKFSAHLLCNTAHFGRITLTKVYF